MRLYWHAAGLQEADWIRDLLDDAVSEEVADVELSRLAAPGIHVVSTNVTPLSELDGRLSDADADRPRILVHLSDEWFSGGYAAYRHFDAVIRTHATHLAVAPGILTIPLGFPNRRRADLAMAPARTRQLAWSFVGEMKASRFEMARAFERVAPSRLVDTTTSPVLPKAAYDELLLASAFAPCPMGNVMLETWRLYEALELGCIPLVERRRFLDYFVDLFGPGHPIPTFVRWSDAASFAGALRAQPEQLDQLQAEIGAWWEDHKSALRRAVRSHIEAEGHRRSLGRFAGSPLQRSAVLYESQRLAELARHQSARSLVRWLFRLPAVVARVRRERRERSRDA